MFIFMVHYGIQLKRFASVERYLKTSADRENTNQSALPFSQIRVISFGFNNLSYRES